MNKKKGIIIALIVLISAAVIAFALTPREDKGDIENGQVTEVQNEQGSEETEVPEDSTEDKKNSGTDSKKDNTSKDDSNSKPQASTDKQDAPAQTATPIETGAEDNMPTFIYFVTNADSDAEATYNKLEKEYKKKVRFELRNIDDEPELANNFPVGGNTPALIMLSPTGDISNILFKTADYDTLKSAIEASFKIKGE